MAFHTAMLLFLGACGTGPRPVPREPIGRCQPPPLISPEELEPSFIWQQRITATYSTAGKRRQVSFVAAVQKQAHRLTVLGLTPWGTRAFEIEQKRRDVRLKNIRGPKLPFPPQHIIADLQRVFFYRLSRHPMPDGTHAGTLHGVRVVERWKEARLQQRRLTQRDCRGDIVVTYFEGMAGLNPPPRITLHHTQFGYTLDIVTLTSQLLDPREDAP